MIDFLIDWGVDVIFGLPGDGINGIMEALRTRQDKIRFIHVRHEEAAAFMACGYAKYTGKLGVCLATSGPGGIHLLNGLYDAKFDGVPVLAITGLHFHDLLNTHSQQDVELDKLFMDVAVYNTRIMGPNHVETATDLACRNALMKRGVAHLTIPVDYQHAKLERKQASERNHAHPVSAVRAASAMLPEPADLRAAAEILNAGKNVALLVGQGALGAAEELTRVAETLGAPIVKALLGKAAVPDDSVYTTGGIGLLGTAPSEAALKECDTLLMVGTSFPYMEFLPKPGQARAVQIDLDPTRIGLRYPVEVGVVGDSRRTLEALIPLLERNANRKFLEKARSRMKDWIELMQERGTREDTPLKPQVVAWELGKQLSEDAIISSDCGTITTWAARQIPIRQGQKFSVSGTLATMACGLPYAIAAAIAYPGRQSIALVGDGGLSMLMAELSTAVKYRLPVKIVVINNDTLGQIKWEQMVMLGNPEYGCDLERIDFAMVARACGAKSYRLEDPKKCADVFREAMMTEGPVLIDAIVDPLEAPMPANITFDQALKFGESLVRGERQALKIAKTIAEDKVREMI
jgi:pyruvate dehydrogenase (quinone)/pyruvate oxidase